jgi:TM2 domain-containing membrane protein YozV
MAKKDHHTSSHSGKSKITATLLAIFLGGIGIHKFYLGQVGWGILYMIFCWTWIPMIIGFIEGLMYLTMSGKDFAEKYP